MVPNNINVILSNNVELLDGDSSNPFFVYIKIQGCKVICILM